MTNNRSNAMLLLKFKQIMKLIDKDALVAKIERRIKTNKECMLGLRNLDYYQGKVDAFNDTISFIDTLEVKEVQEEPVSEDLEEAARKIATRHSHISGDIYYANNAWFFKKGAQWKEKNILKAADGEDLKDET